MRVYNLILNTVILPLGDVIFGGKYLKKIKLWKHYDSLSEDDLITLQNKRLSSILKYASSHVTYYRNIDISETNSAKENLKKFPVLTKDILRSQLDALISNDYEKSTLDINHSSGSSGQQSFTYMTKSHKFYLRALQTHWWSWSGFEIGDKVLQFGISQKRSFLKRLKDLFYRCYYHKAFGLTEKELKSISQKIISKNINYVAGYPSVINQLAINISNINEVDGIICFGDKLFNHHKKNINNAFGKNVKLIDTYGCAEGLLMACRKDLEFYYIMSPHVYIEIVDDKGNPIKDGEMGNILVTCLTNKAMPLIRYKLGDLGIMLPKENYPEKRELQYPLLQKIIGRETDVIKTENGTILNVHSFTGVFEYYQEIKQYKIIQRDLKSITVEYISEKTISKDRLEDLKNRFLHLTKSNLNIKFKKVDIIKPTKSGKPQIIDTIFT